MHELTAWNQWLVEVPVPKGIYKLRDVLGCCRVDRMATVRQDILSYSPSDPQQSCAHAHTCAAGTHASHASYMALPHCVS